jgi:hypothetical protein
MQSTESSKVEYWTKKIVEWKASSMELREYCRSQSISHNTFYYWRRKLRSGKQPLKQQTKIPTTSFAKVEVNEINLNRFSTLRDPLCDAKWIGEFAAALLRGLK